jgi:hypothetical protein
MRTEMFTARHGDRPEADNVAIVMTDGVSNINQYRTVPEADECRCALTNSQGKLMQQIAQHVLTDPEYNNNIISSIFSTCLHACHHVSTVKPVK